MEDRDRSLGGYRGRPEYEAREVRSEKTGAIEAVGRAKRESGGGKRRDRVEAEGIEPRSSAKIAAPSVDATIEPSSRPSSVPKSNSHAAASPDTAAVRKVPTRARLSAGRSTGRISPKPAVSPPSNRIRPSATTPMLRASS